MIWPMVWPKKPIGYNTRNSLSLYSIVYTAVELSPDELKPLAVPEHSNRT